MHGYAWGEWLEPLFLIAPVTIAVASVLYTLTVRSTHSVVLAAGASGLALVELVLSFWKLVMGPLLAHRLSPAAFQAFYRLWDAGLLLFGLVFAISLFLVLNDARRAHIRLTSASS